VKNGCISTDNESDDKVVYIQRWQHVITLKKWKRGSIKIREREYPSWHLFQAAVTVGHWFILWHSVMTFMKVPIYISCKYSRFKTRLWLSSYPKMRALYLCYIMTWINCSLIQTTSFLRWFYATNSFNANIIFIRPNHCELTRHNIYINSILLKRISNDCVENGAKFVGIYNG